MFQERVAGGTAIGSLVDLQPLLAKEESNLRIDRAASGSILPVGVDESDLTGPDTLFP